MVKHLTHNTKIKGLNPALDTSREKMTKSPEAVFLVMRDPPMNEL
jgi:hypothetical protein